MVVTQSSYYSRLYLLPGGSGKIPCKYISSVLKIGFLGIIYLCSWWVLFSSSLCYILCWLSGLGWAGGRAEKDTIRVSAAFEDAFLGNFLLFWYGGDDDGL